MLMDEWGSAVAKEVSELKVVWNLEDLTLRRSLSGKSGASIFLVDAKGSYDGHAILKIFPDNQTKEIARHAAAVNEGGTFGERHFPKIARQHFDKGWSAALMTVAAEGL